MFKLSTTGLKWLKGIHLAAVACWIGGAVSLLTLYFLKSGVDDGGVLFGINQSAHHVDLMVIVLPGAYGCLLTGLAYGLFTRWGFIRHGWVILKWVVTLTAILFGTFFLGPWETAMMNISGQLGLAALADETYLYNQHMNLTYGFAQTAVLLATVFVSVFKPWKNLKWDREGK